MCICAVLFDLVLIPDAISLFNVFCSQASAETSTVVAYHIYMYILLKRINASHFNLLPLCQYNKHYMCFRMGLRDYPLRRIMLSIFNE